MYACLFLWGEGWRFKWYLSKWIKMIFYLHKETKNWDIIIKYFFPSYNHTISLSPLCITQYTSFYHFCLFFFVWKICIRSAHKNIIYVNKNVCFRYFWAPTHQAVAVALSAAAFHHQAAGTEMRPPPLWAAANQSPPRHIAAL